MDLESEVISVDDSDVEIVGEEKDSPSVSSGSARPKTNKRKQNNPIKRQDSSPEPMDTDGILPKNDQT